MGQDSHRTLCLLVAWVISGGNIDPIFITPPPRSCASTALSKHDNPMLLALENLCARISVKVSTTQRFFQACRKFVFIRQFVRAMYANGKGL